AVHHLDRGLIALHGRGLGGHVRLPDASRQQHDQATVAMVDRPEPDERFAHALHRHGGHHPHVAAATVAAGGEHTTEHQRVHHGAEHPDVVRLGPADPPVLGHPAAEVVAAAHDHGYLHAEIVHGENLPRDVGQAGRVHAASGRPRQRLPAELEDHPAIPHVRHYGSSGHNGSGEVTDLIG